MVPLKDFKTVKSDDYFHDAIESLNFNHWGGVFIVDKTGKLEGIFTDGDARRVLTKNQNPIAMLNATPITHFMTANPKVIKPELSIREALKMMNDKSILVMPVVNEQNKLVGLLHLQHAVKHLLANL